MNRPARDNRILVARVSIVAWSLIGWIGAGPLWSQELTPYTPEQGGFRVLLPGEPKHEQTTVGDGQDASDVQDQYIFQTKDGVYLVSYQDNPNLEGADAALLDEAFVRGRAGLKKIFGGELLEEKEIELQQKYPGRELRFTIPQAKGEAKCRMFLVGTRLYQVMAVGLPEFVNTDRTDSVLESFQLAP